MSPVNPALAGRVFPSSSYLVGREKIREFARAVIEGAILNLRRILAEFDMPPAILADQNRDISLSPAEWREEVAKGVAA